MTQSVCESASRQPAVLPASMRVGIARGRVKLGLIFSFNGAFLPSSSERPSECVAYLPRAPATVPGSVGWSDSKENPGAAVAVGALSLLGRVDERGVDT